MARSVRPQAHREGTVNLLFVGRLEERKGADALLAIIPGLLAAHAELVAHIVGEDNIPVGDETLRRRYEGDNAASPDVLARTRFYGALPRRDVLAHYAGCDLFVAPSKYESFGLIFIEAMCFGKPVVAYDVGGAAEIIDSGRDGWLVPAGQPQKLAGAIHLLVGSRSLREDLGRNARKTYEARYAAPLMIDRLEAYYRRVARQRFVKPERLKILAQ
jgi:glycosyltransferase involved in cell wall biosynthesis